MANMDLLLRSISFIEDHLDDDIQTEDIAKACYASKSALEKVFKFTTHFSVHDYIIRRRMMKAAKLMIYSPELSLLDVAVQYGYSSHEAFTRAFFQVWNCNPSEFKARYEGSLHVAELFPRVEGVYQEEKEEYMRRRVDISELYDFFKERKDCWFVLCDINSLIPINNISHKAGDIALVETLGRIIQCSNDEDVVFRIGADEFVLITNSTKQPYAEEIKDKILALNGQTFDFEDKKIPLNIWASTYKVQNSKIQYGELFQELQEKIRGSKRY